VPDDTPDHAVVAAFRGTVNLTWLFDDLSEPDAHRGRYTFAWPELGQGVIIRS
jgi:hypothetical protein